MGGGEGGLRGTVGRGGVGSGGVVVVVLVVVVVEASPVTAV